MKRLRSAYPSNARKTVTSRIKADLLDGVILRDRDMHRSLADQLQHALDVEGLREEIDQVHFVDAIA